MSVQRQVEHFKNVLQNITTDGTPHSVPVCVVVLDALGEHYDQRFGEVEYLGKYEALFYALKLMYREV